MLVANRDEVLCWAFTNVAMSRNFNKYKSSVLMTADSAVDEMKTGRKLVSTSSTVEHDQTMEETGKLI